MNKNELPRESQIRTQRTAEGTVIYWKNPDHRLYRLGTGTFMLFWMGGWLVGEISVTRELWVNYQEGKLLDLFFLFWLGAWTVGGIITAVFLLAFLRGPSPSKLILDYRELRYKRGRIFLSSFSHSQRKQQSDELMNFLREGKLITARKDEVSNLRLGHAGERLRVTFDLGLQRIELGESLTEPEKEWLYQTLENWLN